MLGRRALLWLLVCWMASGSVWADYAPMTQDEFCELLSGNSIVGQWAGEDYRQYFAETGSTTYAQRGSRKTYGTWRISDDGKYRSIWPPCRPRPVTT